MPVAKAWSGAAASLGLFTILVALVLILAWAFQRRLVYFPFGDVPPPADVGLPGAEPVRFGTADGLELEGWFVRSERQPASFTVIVFSGNGGNRAFRAPLASALARRGMSVLLFDYRGYGGNPGTPSEVGLAADARAARAYVDSLDDVDAAPVVYFGESLGTGVAITLAAERPPYVLILRSPFTSLVDIGQFHYPILPVRWLLRDRFLSSGRIREVRCPVLVIAGERDTIVPFEHSRRLYDGAREPKQWVAIPNADHNDFDLLAGARMIEAIAAFLMASRS